MINIKDEMHRYQRHHKAHRFFMNLLFILVVGGAIGAFVLVLLALTIPVG